MEKQYVKRGCGRLKVMTANGRDFNSLKLKAKILYEAKDLYYTKIKTYIVTLKNGNKIHFGDKIDTREEKMRRMEQYDDSTFQDPNHTNFWISRLLWF